MAETDDNHRRLRGEAMKAFNDATCPCGERVGWFGEWDAQPDCPACGRKPDMKEAAEVEKRLDEARRKVLAEWDAEDD